MLKIGCIVFTKAVKRNMDLRNIEKITCKCGFILRKRIGCVVHSTVLWNLSESGPRESSVCIQYTRDKKRFNYWRNYLFGGAPKLRQVFFGIEQFHCPRCNRILENPKKIRKIIKRYKLLNKLAQPKVEK